MTHIILVAFASLALLQNQPVEEAGFLLMKSESIGELKLDMYAAEVEKLLGPPAKKGKATLWEAIGQHVEEWEWPKQGLLIQMSSDKKDSTKTVLSIELRKPGKLITKRGIGIGSSEAEVRKAYGALEEKETSKPGHVFVAGSYYGGMIFNFNNHKVGHIFLGAAAE